MSHLEYYQYQAIARGVHGIEDVRKMARERAYVYDQIVGRWLPQAKASKITDLACGHGSFLCWLYERGYTNLRGVDSSPEQVALARMVGVHVDQTGVMEWLSSQPENYCDLLFALDFIEHISKDDFMLFLNSANRALKPGGRLILRYPNGDSPFVGLNLFNDITHVWTYTTVCLTSLSQMHNFAGIEFVDEGIEAIRDARWIKVPLARLCQKLLRIMFQAASRERLLYWNSSIWAALSK